MKSKYRIRDFDANTFWGEKVGLAGVVDIQGRIPEFTRPYDMREYDRRLTEERREVGLNLLVTLDEEPIGYLVSYSGDECKNEKELYLWMGAVVPEHRNKGIMSALLDLTEYWAIEMGYSNLLIKTFPEFKGMISLLKKYGFNHVGENNSSIYKKVLDNRKGFGFQNTDVYKRIGDKFDIDVSWNVKKVVVDKVKSAQPRSLKMMCSWFGLDMESGKHYDLAPDCRGKGFNVGDYIEIGLNDRDEPAWIGHPGHSCHFRNRSLEKRESEGR